MGVMKQMFSPVLKQVVRGLANGSGGGVSNWILDIGTWSDSKIWIDTETWND